MIFFQGEENVDKKSYKCNYERNRKVLIVIRDFVKKFYFEIVFYFKDPLCIQKKYT